MGGSSGFIKDLPVDDGMKCTFVAIGSENISVEVLSAMLKNTVIQPRSPMISLFLTIRIISANLQLQNGLIIKMSL